MMTMLSLGERKTHNSIHPQFDAPKDELLSDWNWNLGRCDIIGLLGFHDVLYGILVMTSTSREIATVSLFTKLEMASMVHWKLEQDFDSMV